MAWTADANGIFRDSAVTGSAAVKIDGNFGTVSDALTAKASKAASPTAGHLASLDSDGNPTDSGLTSSSFDTAGAAAAVATNLATHAALTGAAAHGLGTASTHPASDFATAAHTHAESDVTGLVADLAAKASAASLSTHTGNTSNPHAVTAAQVGAYTTAQADTLLAAKASTTHTHAESDVTNLVSDLAAKATTSALATTNANVSGHTSQLATTARTIKVFSGTLAGGGGGASVNLDQAISGLGVKDRIRVRFYITSVTMTIGAVGFSADVVDGSADAMTGDVEYFASPTNAAQSYLTFTAWSLFAGPITQGLETDQAFAINGSWTLRNIIAVAAGGSGVYRVEISVIPGV